MEARSYDQLIDAANEARIATDDAIAIELYQQALAMGGERDLEARWMLGVSLINDDQFEAALGELDTVLKTISDAMKPNVLRDRARVLGKLERYDEAEVDIAKALELFANKEPIQAAMTIGFRARLELAQGETNAALDDFKVADTALTAGENRHYELFNKLHYAEALMQHGDKELGRQVLAEADALIPEFGGAKHTERAKKLHEEAD